MNHSRSKTYLKNVIFLSTIPMNHNEQKTSILTKEKTACGGNLL